MVVYSVGAVLDEDRLPVGPAQRGRLREGARGVDPDRPGRCGGCRDDCLDQLVAVGDRHASGLAVSFGSKVMDVPRRPRGRERGQYLIGQRRGVCTFACFAAPSVNASIACSTSGVPRTAAAS